jgi:hypothetical protein
LITPNLFLFQTFLFVGYDGIHMLFELEKRSVELISELNSQISFPGIACGFQVQGNFAK